MGTDKEKLNDLFARIRGFEFPECETDDGKQVVKEIKEGFDIILTGMKDAAKQVNNG